MPDPLEATQAQCLQLLSSEISEEPGSGSLIFTIAIPGSIPVESVRIAWKMLLQTHAALRVRYQVVDGQVCQEVRGYHDLPPATRDLAPSAEVAVPDFDAFGEVLVRLAVAPAGRDGEPTRLLLAVHHVLVDEAAVGRLTDDLGHLLLGRALPGPALSPELSAARYQDAVRAVLTAQESASGSRAYWCGRYQPPPTARVTMAAPDADEAPPRHSLGLGSADLTALRELARRANASPAMTVQAALAALLRHYGCGSRVAVGVPMSLRDHPAIGFDLVGLFLNVLPVVTEAHPDMTLRQVVADARRRLIEVQTHKYTPLTRLPELTGLPRSVTAAGEASFFDVVLAVGSGSPQPGGGVRVTASAPGAAPNALTVSVILAAERPRITVERHPAATDRPAPATLARDLLRVLHAMADNLDQPVGDLGRILAAPSPRPEAPHR
ncbi:condensation domain-containing protein [Kitasatospora acidiphila]|uniref:condensation domain-containing protein n=1 Tax=Kitasatospora acidiphila TaxID=2567942 RepID=UPI003C72EE39